MDQKELILSQTDSEGPDSPISGPDFSVREYERSCSLTSLKSDAGAQMVEYALIICVLAFAILISMNYMREEACSLFSQAGSAVAIR